MSLRSRAAILLAVGIAGCGHPATGGRLLFVGDMQFAREVAVEVAATGGSPLDSIAPFLQGADWVAGNLEGALGRDADCRVPAGALCFAFAESSAVLLARAGFDAVTVANNHAGDLGPSGRIHTRARLAEAGVMGADFEHSPSFVRVGERTVALVAVDLVPAADGRFETIPSVAVAQKIRLARTLAEIVVVSVHWGRELQAWPSAAQRKAARWLVAQGADLVVGHHPHVVQDPECLDGRPVFFSLGNHVFDQRYPETKIGLIADCRIEGARFGCAGIGTQTRMGSAVPVLGDTVPSDALARCKVALHPALRLRGQVIRPVPWSSEGDGEGLVLEGGREGAEPWRSRPVDAVALETGLEGEGGERLLFSLERHPSDLDSVVALRPHVYDVGPAGLIAKWRGTTLAWPLLDAALDPGGALCALHRGDSFIRPDPTVTTTRTMQYRWNGFGFSATNDPAGNAACTLQMKELTQVDSSGSGDYDSPAKMTHP